MEYDKWEKENIFVDKNIKNLFLIMKYLSSVILNRTKMRKSGTNAI